MIDYLSIGSTPADEPCASLGKDNYAMDARREGKAFINQLKRRFGEPPAMAIFKLKSFPHDFGTYYEVCVVFSDTDEESIEFAYKVERETPQNWDEEAKKELGLTVMGGA